MKITPDKILIDASNLLLKASNVTSEGITISSMTGPDRPLIYVNQGFERLTGYTKDEVLGKNCRFLQGKKTSFKSVEKIRQAIRNGESCTVELLNYKKDGTPFWNRLSITPITNAQREVTHYVGIQSDITELKKTKAKLETVNQKLIKFRQHIMGDLDRARIMQQFLLPHKLPKSSHCSFASLFVPMEQIGGDFFDIIELNEGIYGILIADVTGHGIPAALLTFMSSTTFKNSAPGELSTAKAITETNKKLFNKMPDDSFVTMFYAIYDSHLKKLTYTQAGHPEAYLVRSQSQEVIPLKTNNTLVGIFSNAEIKFSEESIDLQQGDKLIMYTDAISEALNSQNHMTSEQDFQTFLRKNCALPLKELFDALYKHGLQKMKKKSYEDDFTLLGFEVKK